MIYKNINELIGKTPVLEMDGVYLKLESFNASGSVKDRAVKWMIEDLEKKSLLKQDSRIVEATSGNTGISLAMIGAAKGYQITLVMPENMSVERRSIMKAYGAKIILTDSKTGMTGALAKAWKLVEEEGYIMLNQFSNPANVLAHEESTALEILEDFQTLDYFVSGIGTGGTITGVGKVLKQHFKNIKIIGVEPEESPFLSKGIKGVHGVQGIGAGFQPAILDRELVDEIRTISTEKAYQETSRLAKRGLFLGISSGAAIKIGLELYEETKKKVLVIAPDGGWKYLSNNIY